MMGFDIHQFKGQTMTISIRCDGCHSTYNVPDEMVGKKAKCKKCGQLLLVAAPLMPAGSANIAAMCAQCGAKYSVGAAMAGKRVKCKKCGGAFEVPDPHAPLLAEIQDDPMMTAAAHDPFATGGGNWNDPMAMPAPTIQPNWQQPAMQPNWQQPAMQPNWQQPMMQQPQAAWQMPGKPPANAPGVSKVVWIVAGAGGGALLLLIVLLVFVFSGRDKVNQNGGAVAANGGTGTGTNSGTGIPTPTAPGTATNTPGSTANDNLPPANDAAAWTWKADLPTPGPADLAQQPLKLLDRPNEVFFARGDVAQAAISYRRSADGKNDVLIQRLDLKTGQTLAEQSFEQNTKLLDLSQEGTAFLILPGANYASYETLQVWRWTDKAAQQAGQWTPYSDQSSKRITWSMLIDANRIATGHSQLKFATVWDASGKLVSRIPFEGGNQPLLSPGGKYLVQHSGIWLRFFETATLKHAGSIGPLSSNYVTFIGLAYRPDGQAIAATFQHPNGGTFVTWDAAKRQKQVEFEVPILSSPLAWINDDHLLAGAYLLSVSNEMPVWNYVGASPIKQTIDHRIWYQTYAGSEQYLAAAVVPSPQVQSNIEKYVAANVPILKAGDTVGLQVQIKGSPPSADFQQKLTQTVTAHLQGAGYTVGEGQPFRLRVTLEDKDSGQQITYSMFGSAGGPSTINVPDRRIECEVAFVDSTDKVVWRSKTTIGPSSFSMSRGQSDFAKQVLDARWTSFDGWIQNVRIASLVRKLSSTGEFGSSMLQADGERVIKVPTN